MYWGRPKEVHSLTKRPRRASLSRQAGASPTSTSRKLALDGGTLNPNASRLRTRYSLDRATSARARARYSVSSRADSRRGLGQAVDAPIRLVRAQRRVDFRRGEGVADTQRSQGVGLGHRAQISPRCLYPEAAKRSPGRLPGRCRNAPRRRRRLRPGPALSRQKRRTGPAVPRHPCRDKRRWGCLGLHRKTSAGLVDSIASAALSMSQAKSGGGPASTWEVGAPWALQAPAYSP